MLTFAIRWLPYGGGAAEDIMVTFGTTPEVYFRRLHALLDTTTEPSTSTTTPPPRCCGCAGVDCSSPPPQVTTSRPLNDRHAVTPLRQLCGPVQRPFTPKGINGAGKWRAMNAVSTPPRLDTGRTAAVDPSDLAQAGVFVDMLTDEITAVSVRVDEAEQLARAATRTGRGTARLWHNEEARAQRKMLYELHRQLDALHRRFPDTVAETMPARGAMPIGG